MASSSCITARPIAAAGIAARRVDAVGQSIAYYVDSVAGSDSNDGLSEATPLKTLGAVPRIDGSAILLKRGSHWRETLGLSARTGISVAAYGSGDRPLIDCSDIAANANFSKSGGYTNIYEISMTHSLSATNSKFSVFEDGTRLTRATSMANCDATPGSFYAATPGASPQLVYVHATASGNPASNGKLYEVSVRDHALVSSVRGDIISVQTCKNGHNNGSLISNHYAYDCVARDGTRHNFWVQGIAINCSAIDAEIPTAYGDATLFVTYKDSGTGMTARYINCTATGQGRSGKQLGFYAHTAGVAGQEIESIIYDGCVANSLAEGFGVQNTKKRILYKCTANTCGYSISSGSSVSKNYVIGGFFSSWTMSDAIPARHYSASAATNLIVRGATFVSRLVSGGMIYGGFSQGLDVENCDFLFINTTSFPQAAISTTSASAVFNNKKNVFVSCSAAYETLAGATVASENNCIYPSTTDVKWNGTTYANVAAYKTASGLDVNSITTDPQIVGGAANAAPVYAPESGVWAIGAGSGVLTAEDLAIEYGKALAA